MVQVFSEPLSRRQYAHWISHAVVYRVLSWLSTLLVSAVIAYTAGGIWEKYSVAIGQADVRFTYDMIVVLEGNAGERVWSSYPALNNALAARQISASVQVAEDDFDNDGKVDSFDVTWTGYGAEDVRGVKALCQFRYIYDEVVTLDMYGLGFLEKSAGYAGSGVYFDGELAMHQSSVLWAGSKRSTATEKMLSDPGAGTDTLQPTVETDLVRILASYREREEVTMVEKLTSVWQGGDSSEFTMRMKIRVPKAQHYTYRRERLEVFLLGWVKVLAIFFVLWWVVENILTRPLFRFRVFSTRVVSDVEKKLHQF